MPDRRTAWIPITIFVVALALRAQHVLELRGTVFFENLMLDAERYDAVAQDLAAGRGFNEPVFTMSPIYPVFLAGVYRVFGHDLLAPRIIQILLGSATCVLIFLLARKWFGTLAGAVSGFAAAAYQPFVAYDSILMPASLCVTWIVALLILLDRASRTRRRLDWFVCGLLLGFGALLRPNSLPLALVAMGWLAWHERRNAWKSALSLTMGLLLPIAPVTARNYWVGGDCVLVTASGGMNFYIGNHEKADGTFIPPEDLVGHPTALMRYAQRRAEAETRGPLRISEVSRFWYGKAFDFIREHPFRWVALLLWKAKLFWSAMEWPSSYNLDFMSEHLCLFRLPLLSFGLVAPFGLLGLVYAWRRWQEYFWGYAALLVFWAALAAFFILDHYRLPAAAIVIVFAGHGASRLAQRLRDRGWKSAAISLFALVAFGTFVHWPRPQTAGLEATAHFNLGSIYQRQGDHVRAIEEFRQFLGLHLKDGLGTSRLGLSLAASGEVELGQAALEEAMRLSPSIPEIHNNLGIFWGNRGETSRAAEYFRAALSLDPGFPEARHNLEEALSRMERH